MSQSHQPDSDADDDERLFKLGFGMWKDRDIDGVEYTRALRAEWDERFPTDPDPAPGPPDAPIPGNSPA